MDIWHRARTFSEDAAKRSQELTKEAAKRSQEFTKEATKRSQDFSIGSSKLSDIFSEASKRSKEIAAEASKRADFIKVEALKRADQIKSQIPPAAAALSHLVDSSASAPAPATAVQPEDLEKFGVTDELREFVKDITLNTFQDFPLEGVMWLFPIEMKSAMNSVYIDALFAWRREGGAAAPLLAGNF